MIFFHSDSCPIKTTPFPGSRAIGFYLMRTIGSIYWFKWLCLLMDQNYKHIRVWHHYFHPQWFEFFTMFLEADPGVNSYGETIWEGFIGELGTLYQLKGGGGLCSHQYQWHPWQPPLFFWDHNSWYGKLSIHVVVPKQLFLNSVFHQSCWQCWEVHIHIQVG